MSEETLIAGEDDPGLRERLDQEINAFNDAVTGYHECGRTPGYPRGYDSIHLVKRLG